VKHDVDNFALVLAELRELRAEVGALRAAVSRIAGPALDDHAAELVARLHMAAGDRLFSVSEVIDHAAVDKELRDAVIEAAGELNARRLGHVLRRLHGRVFGERVVERVGMERGAAVWRVRGM
jgi:hypothetical protein